MSAQIHCPACHEVVEADSDSESLPRFCPQCKGPLPSVEPAPSATAPPEEGNAWWVPGQTAPESSDAIASEPTPVEASSTPAVEDLAPEEPTPEPSTLEEPAVEEPTASQNAILWGSLALLLGLVGFGLAWLPRLATLGMVAGGVGLAFGLLGALLILMRKEKGIPFALTACAVSLQALILGLVLPKVQGSDSAPPPAQLSNRPVYIVHQTGEKSIRELLQTIEAKEPTTRKEGVEALGKLGAEIDSSIPALTELLHTEAENDVRKTAVEALARMGSPARGAYPVLMNMARVDPSKEVRDAAQKAIEAIGRPSQGDLPTLLRALERPIPYPTYRASVAQVMTWIADSTMPHAVGPLKIALIDTNPRVRLFAAQAIWMITSKADVSVLSEFRQALQHRDGDLRAAATHALGLLGESARQALPDLKEALKDDDLRVRLYAAQAVWGLNRDADEVVPIFRVALESNDPNHRATAAEILGHIGPAAREAIPHLLTMLTRDPEKDLRARAAFALGQIGPEASDAVPFLIEMLDDPDLALREQAVYALQGIGPDAQAAVGPLEKLLSDVQPTLRGRSALALAAIGSPAAGTLGSLRKALDETTDPSIRVFLAQALWAIDPDRPQAGDPPEKWQISPALQEALTTLCAIVQKKELDASVRVAAARVLGQIGPLARVAVPALHHVQQDEDDQLAQAVEFALLTIGHPAEQDVMQLKKLLTSKNLEFTQLVVRTLWLIGPDAKEAVGELTMLFTQTDASQPVGVKLRLAVVETLAALGDRSRGATTTALDSALPILIETFAADGTSPEMHLALAEAFQAAGSAAKNAVEPLTKVLETSKVLEVRLAVMEALGAIGPEAKPAVKTLREVLSEQDTRVLSMAVLALTGIGAEAKAAVPHLRELLEHDNDLVRVYAAQALVFVDQDVIRTVPVLTKLLASDRSSIRATSAAILASIAKSFPEKVKPAEDKLKALLEDRSLDVRKAAREALEALGK